MQRSSTLVPMTRDLSQDRAAVGAACCFEVTKGRSLPSITRYLIEALYRVIAGSHHHLAARVEIREHRLTLADIGQHRWIE